jgi:hypothetical protein
MYWSIVLLNVLGPAASPKTVRCGAADTVVGETESAVPQATANAAIAAKMPREMVVRI